MAPKQICPEHLADAMGLSVDRLWAFARNIDTCYKPRRMQWDGKKHRPIDPLYKAPKRLLRKLHLFFQSNRLSHPSAHGGVQGKSCFSSARNHIGRRFIWTRDAANCYPSIGPQAMRSELRALGFRSDTAKLLTLIFIYRGGVPQGSPVSGDALNLFFWRLDQLLASVAGDKVLGYSRVADDFVISGNSRDQGEVIIARLEEELARRGIRVNDRKKEKHGLQTCSEERLVHSISVSKPRGTAISRVQAFTALALADNFVAACRSVTADSIQAVAAKRATLTGWMYYCRQAEFGPARTLKQRLDAGDRHVLRKLRCARISAKKNKWWVVNHAQRRNEPKRLAIVWRQREEQLMARQSGSSATANLVPIDGA